MTGTHASNLPYLVTRMYSNALPFFLLQLFTQSGKFCPFEVYHDITSIRNSDGPEKWSLLSISSSTGSKYRADFWLWKDFFIMQCIHCLYLVSAMTGLAVASCVCTMFCAFHWMKKVCLTASVMFSIFLIGWHFVMTTLRVVSFSQSCKICSITVVICYLLYM